MEGDISGKLSEEKSFIEKFEGPSRRKTLLKEKAIRRGLLLKWKHKV